MTHVEPVGDTNNEIVLAVDRDKAYAERDELVAFLTRLWPSHLAVDPDDLDWPVVCIHSPAGQLTWHVPVREIETIFNHLIVAPNDWDGHEAVEKYARLAKLPGG